MRARARALRFRKDLLLSQITDDPFGVAHVTALLALLLEEI